MEPPAAVSAGCGTATSLPDSALQTPHLDQYRGIIRRLFIDEDLSLDQVMAVMKRDHNVIAS